MINNSLGWQWQMADTNGGTYTDIESGDADGITSAMFTPRDGVVGKFLQVCAIFMDDAGNDERRCRQITMSVLDVNDAPTPKSNTVEVLVTATAAKPYRFTEADFLFTDNDDPNHRNGQLKQISIETVPSFGILRRGTAMATNGVVPRANIGDLNYYPDPDQQPTRRGQSAAYASFSYHTTDNSGATNDTTPFVGTIFIRLIEDPTVAEGEPAVTYARGNAPTEHIAITANQGGIMDTSNDDPAVLGTIAWQWSQADTLGGSYSNIAGAPAMTATFTPGTNQAGKFLRVCASFTDEDSNRETRCLQIAEAVINVNDPPSGTVTLSGATGTGLESEEISVAVQNLDDPDGVENIRQTWQWQQAAPVNDAAPAAGSDTWSDIEDATMAEFTPDQPQVGQHLRACAAFTDDGGSDERLCSNPIGPVVNINDAPVATAKTVTVPDNASADSPYTFSDADFLFDDEDMDNLVSITLQSLPSGGGTLRVGETAATVGQMVNRADIGTISYYPAANQMPNPSYDMFTFNVTDDGDGPGGTTTDARTSTNNAVITISLVSSEQMPAGGLPAIDGSITQQKSALGAGLGTVSDVNGIDEMTIMWHWQQAAPVNNAAPAADSADWTDISDPAAEPAFTPEQAQVDHYLRVCITFMDRHATAPRREGPLCSAATPEPIGDVNDAPMARPYTEYAAEVVTVGDFFIAAITPQAFLGAYSDPDGNPLVSVTITETPPLEHGGLHYGPDGNAGDTQITNELGAAQRTFRVTADGAQFVDDVTQTRQFLSFNISTINREFDLPQTTLKFTLSDRP